MNFSLVGNIVDIELKNIYKGKITIQNGFITSIEVLNETADPELNYITPGFIDAHIHIESSMLIPSEFARLAVVHGTVGTVSDSHEIANVCGIPGVEFMIENGNTVPFKFHFGAPSCVPATIFETSGAILDSNDVNTLLERKDIFYLSEMMNYPGVINDDPEIIKKIEAAKKNNKPVDGHAPGLSGEQLKKYISSGITTDHECSTKAEAYEKLQLDMKILIREGSAAKNFNALISLLEDHYDDMMFCSDDKHPDELVLGHINILCKRAGKLGIDKFKILQAACINPVKHYQLKIGQLKIGDPADFITVNNLEDLEVQQTYINGQLVADNGRSFIKSESSSIINNFNCKLKEEKDFNYEFLQGLTQLNVIEALDGQILTKKLTIQVQSNKDGSIIFSEKDILKIVVINRYNDAPVSIAYIRNFGIKNGAIASSVAHDSHNIIAIGSDDHCICKAVNQIIVNQGGISVYSKLTDSTQILPLPIAGLMSNNDGYSIAKKYTQIDQEAKKLGTKLTSPFMTLSFLALLVIPELKLSDKGLFDVSNFQFTHLNY